MPSPVILPPARIGYARAGILGETLEVGIYQRYAEVYDRSGQVLFAIRMIPYLDKLLRRHLFPGRRVLDLACGTGTIALAFAQRGYEVVGLDASEAMLAQARSRAEEVNDRLELVCQDMRSFTVWDKVGLITCLYDSMNYMLEEADLLRVFKCAASAIAPGGLFVFDMNTAWMMEHVLDEKTEFFESGPLSLVMVHNYDREKRRATVKIVGFIRRDGLYEKFSETHVEQSYTEEQVYRNLEKAGFWVEGEYGCFGFEPPVMDTARIMWVARRKSRRSARRGDAYSSRT